MIYLIVHKVRKYRPPPAPSTAAHSTSGAAPPRALGGHRDEKARQESSIQAGRPKIFFIWPPFFQYNRRLLRQKAGGACLYIPQDGHWLASFEVILNYGARGVA